MKKERFYIKENRFNRRIVEWLEEKFDDDFNREMLMDKNGVLRVYYTDFVIELMD